MKIAVTHENGKVFDHFGHSKEFKIYEVLGGEIVSSEVVAVKEQGHSAVAGFLLEQGADVIICGCIGDGAKNALYSQGMILFGGVEGDCDEVVKDFLGNCLAYDPNVACEHHHDEEEGCGCGSDEEEGCGCHSGGCSCGSGCGCH